MIDFDFQKQLLIVGCGGHSKVITEIAELNGFSNINYFDKKKKIKTFLNKNVTSSIKKDFSGYFFIAVVIISLVVVHKHF